MGQPDFQLTTSGNLRQSPSQQFPISAVGGYVPPLDTSLFGSSAARSLGLDPNTTGLGFKRPTTGFWAPGNNSVLGKNYGGGVGGVGGVGTGIGWNTETLGIGIQGLAAIGGLYNAFQSNKLAKDQFNFTKEVTNTNLNNQIKTFNTTMEDRARARARLDGREDTEGYTQDYMNKNRISRG